MNFIDLPAQQKRLRAEIERRIGAILDHGQYILGPENAELEKALAVYTGAKYALTCASGTDALMMGLMAYGVGPGDAIIVPSFTFVATAEVVSLLGATPVFAEIDSKSYNLDPGKLESAISIAKKKGLRPKGIIPVDLFGLGADYDEIGVFARKHSLFVIEDGCQGYGGEYKGKKLCAFGDLAATSFYPSKPLGCYGDGGAIFTDNHELYDKLKSIRVHGMGTDKYDNIRIGINGRMDTFQAAVLLAKLGIFEEEIETRQKVAAKYTEALSGTVVVPHIPDDRKSAWAQYSILTDNRDAVISEMKKDGVPAMVFYPIPLHLQTAYRNLGYKIGDLPVSEEIASKIMSLPMHPYLSYDDIAKVVAAVKRAIQGSV